MSSSRTPQNVLAILVVLSFGILCNWPAAAQAEGSFGFFGGINMAKMGGDIDLFGDLLADVVEAGVGGDWTSENTNQTGPGFGVYYLKQFSPTFGLSFEGQYIQRGTKLDLKGTNVPDFPINIDASADNSPWHRAFVFIFSGHISSMWTAITHRNTKTLGRANSDISIHFTR